ncbi:MAG TPA: rod shape-determining protein RodA [Acidimicrobiia bacterium]|jgi:rod shape determining protein RodA|nr:rod shape-determining protein RodA [Acidimicrobiia bacterium]
MTATLNLSTERAQESMPFRHLDFLLILSPFAITALGILMIYSSTRTRLSLEHVDRFYYVERQGIALVIGVVLMLVAMAIDYRKLRDLFPLLYIGTLPLLFAVRFIGTGRNSTTAWFQVGPLQFQPSEIAKVVLVITLAGYCHQHRGDLDAWRLAITLGIAFVPMALVMLQNDLGTMLVMCVIVAAVVLVAGIRPMHIATVFLVVATLVGALAVGGKFSGYRLDRLTSFLHQGPVSTESATPAEYNLAESRTAIQHGGLTGTGLYKGTLTKLSYVPAQHTDFIFTVVGEELGFLGGALLLALFALLVWRTWRIALLSTDFFGTLLCIGILAMFAFQVFENMGMTMGIMPITGIPLPFMSYGGSALITYFIAVGLVANVHMRRFT